MYDEPNHGSSNSLTKLPKAGKKMTSPNKVSYFTGEVNV